MDEKTIKALQSSVKAWRERALGTYKGKDGVSGCALCKRFYNKDCKGCPVMAVTGADCCIGSPHPVWESLVDDPNIPVHRVRRAARAEANFLNALLPVKHRLPVKWYED